MRPTLVCATALITVSALVTYQRYEQIP